MHKDSGDLGNLKPAVGATKNRKRIGRGRGSGHGDTATKGNKGAQQRSGYTYRPEFQGGQMPLHRTLPKRGFNVPDRTTYSEVNLTSLKRVEGDEISPELLKKSGLIKGRKPVVLLGSSDGSLAPFPFKLVKVHRITASARSALESAGATIELLAIDPEHLRVKRGPKPKAKKKAKAAE